MPRRRSKRKAIYGGLEEAWYKKYLGTSGAESKQDFTDNNYDTLGNVFNFLQSKGALPLGNPWRALATEVS